MKLFKFKKKRNCPFNKPKKALPKKPWMSNDCLKMRSDVRSLGKRLQKEPNNMFLRQSFSRARKNYNLLKKKLKSEFFKMFLNKVNDLDEKESKSFWKSINSLRHSGHTASNPISAKEWTEHYKSLFTDLNCTNFDLNSDLEGTKDNFSSLDYAFNCNEVKKGIKDLKSGKSGGPDLILNEFIKNSKDSMVLVLVKLFNKILQTGIFPKQWNVSYISSIFKSGNPNDCNNYRGICVSSCLGKLFTSLLQKRLSLFLEDNNLVSSNQGGFKSGYRTSDHIFILKTLINKYLYGKNKNLYVCFVDLRKAFDSVVRKALLTKLLRNKVGGKFYDLIKNMYSNTLYCCKTDNILGEPFLSKIGVKQGDSLSPTLFNIFVDDIKSYFDFNKSNPVTLDKIFLNHLLYADDLVLISESPTGLQHCVDALQRFCGDWSLSVNTQKTKIMILSKFKNRSVIDKYNFYFGSHTLESVQTYKYLGITLDNRGKTKIAAEELAIKARKAYFALKSKIPYPNFISVEKWIKLYNTLILPIMSYGSEIWITDFNFNLDSLDKLHFEKVQNMIMKNILGVHSRASNLALRTEMGLNPVSIKSYILMHKYYLRLVAVESKHEQKFDILKEAFEVEKSLYRDKTFSWLSTLYKIKDTIMIPNLEISSFEFKSSLENFYKDKILRQLDFIKNNNEGKLCFYSKISSSFELKDYLKYNLKKSDRSWITKIRISAHPLAIETGRYSRPKIPASNRTCKFCTNTVEDEVHFILKCPKYKHLREKIKIFKDNDVDTEKLLNPSTEANAREICIYLREAFKIRSLDSTATNLTD